MKTFYGIFIALSVMLSASASAAVISLDFEGVGSGADIGDFYNGGTDSMGNSGVNYGIQFTDAIGCVDSDTAGGNCNSANEPTPETGMIFLNNDSAILDLVTGFETGFSFFYSSNSESAAVNVWSEVGATGALLGSISLLQNANDNCSGDPNGFYCNWDIGSLAFAGIAKSIDFGGTANFIIYDDITFGSVDPGDPQPVSAPAMVSLFGLFIVSLVARSRFRK